MKLSISYCILLLGLFSVTQPQIFIEHSEHRGLLIPVECVTPPMSTPMDHVNVTCDPPIRVAHKRAIETL